MRLDYDERRFPGLGEFRRACLAEDLGVMAEIAGRNEAWYAMENPHGLDLPALARVFRAQHYASENAVDELAALAAAHPWVLEHRWTAQGWLPLTQAAWAGHEEMVDWLLEAGADPRRQVGDPGERTDAAGMARAAGHEALARRLETASSSRR